MLTSATCSDPTPLSIGHAGTSVVSLQVVPWVTGVGHCGSKGCTRATLMTIFRSFGGRTTADSYREDTVSPTFLVTICNASMCITYIQLQGSKRQANVHMLNHASTSTQNQNHTQMHVYASTKHTNTNICVDIPTIVAQKTLQQYIFYWPKCIIVC